MRPYSTPHFQAFGGCDWSNPVATYDMQHGAPPQYYGYPNQPMPADNRGYNWYKPQLSPTESLGSLQSTSPLDGATGYSCQLSQHQHAVDIQQYRMDFINSEYTYFLYILDISSREYVNSLGVKKTAVCLVSDGAVFVAKHDLDIAVKFTSCYLIAIILQLTCLVINNGH